MNKYRERATIWIDSGWAQWKYNFRLNIVSTKQFVRIYEKKIASQSSMVSQLQHSLRSQFYD